MGLGQILVVDDEEHVRELLRLFFTDNGFGVETAIDGEDALRKFIPDKFDCIISDFSMPGRNGLDILQAIRTRDKKVVFLMITGYPTLDNAIKAIKEGATDYITKPFNLEDIKFKVLRALEAQKTKDSLKKVTGLFWALIISIPIWLTLGVMAGLIWNK